MSGAVLEWKILMFEMFMYVELLRNQSSPGTKTFKTFKLYNLLSR